MSVVFSCFSKKKLQDLMSYYCCDNENCKKKWKKHKISFKKTSVIIGLAGKRLSPAYDFLKNCACRPSFLLQMFVFQRFGLFPHKTVIQNVGYGLEMQGKAEEERNKISIRIISATVRLVELKLLLILDLPVDKSRSILYRRWTSERS